MGLLSTLHIGTSGLAASQLGMDITGQNIANADVNGYSRKRLNMAANYRWDGNFGQMGFGVSIINIERMRDVFIDQQIQRQNQDLGMYLETNNALENVENILTEPSDTGIMSFIDKFFDSWENVANNPADMSARTMVKTNGEILNDAFHNIYNQLRSFQDSRNEEIQKRVEKINELTKEIYNLNREISAVEINNQNANDSRDTRDLQVKKLSQLIDATVVEHENGQVTITTGGNILVSPVDAEELEVISTPVILPNGSATNTVGVRFSHSKRSYIPAGGELKGLIDSRDIIIPEYIDWINKLAIGVSNKVNDLHLQGYTLAGYNGVYFFDPTMTGASDISLSASIVSDLKNIAAAGGATKETAVTNTLLANYLSVGSPISLSKSSGTFPPAPSSNSIVHNIIKGSVVVSASAVTLQEEVDYHVDYVTGQLYLLNAGYNNQAFTVSFNYKTGNFTGPGDNSNALAIAKLRHGLTMDDDALGNPTASYDQFYSSIIGRLGLTKNEAEANLSSRQFMVKQYESSQDSISGVSLDEEMTELIKFQHTYQASAQIITTINKMLDILMNM